MTPTTAPTIATIKTTRTQVDCDKSFSSLSCRQVSLVPIAIDSEQPEQSLPSLRFPHRDRGSTEFYGWSRLMIVTGHYFRVCQNTRGEARFSDPRVVRDESRLEHMPVRMYLAVGDTTGRRPTNRCHRSSRIQCELLFADSRHAAGVWIPPWRSRIIIYTLTNGAFLLLF